MEEVLAAHPDVAECAVIGIADPLKGQVPLGFIVLKAGTNTPPDTVSRDVLALVRERIGAVAGLRAALVVQRLPKTRSGKILRGTMRHIADGEDYRVPATIDDPAILDEIAGHLREAGLAKPQ
jgi:propionyl-CoA synthetase